MNNDNVSNKRAFMIATMLSAVLLAASSITSLVPTRAFALDLDIAVPEVDLDTGTVFAEEANQNSDGEEGPDTSGTSSSSSDDIATREASPVDAETNPNVNREEDTSRVEEEDGSVQVDPIVQTEAGADVNVDVETDVVLDEEDCEEANSDISQRNERVSEQQANREGRQGENSLYVSPSVQTDQHFALNFALDSDIVLVEGCNPTDNIEQESVVVSDQGLDSVIEQPGSGSSRAIVPSYQTSNVHDQNMIVEEDVFRPVAGL